MLVSECIKTYERRSHWELKRLVWTKENELDNNIDLKKTLVGGI
jgi:hypothetical protein